LTHETQDPGWAKYHVAQYIHLLDYFAIYPSCECEVFSVAEYFWAYKSWPQGREFVKCLSKKELTTSLLGHLKKTTGNVIPDCIAQYIRFRLLRTNTATFSGHDKDELPLDKGQVMSLKERPLQNAILGNHLEIGKTRGTKLVHWNGIVWCSQ
jgi:hypothetical protein